VRRWLRDWEKAFSRLIIWLKNLQRRTFKEDNFDENLCNWKKWRKKSFARFFKTLSLCVKSCR
jgi:hypothetical protein